MRDPTIVLLPGVLGFPSCSNGPTHRFTSFAFRRLLWTPRVQPNSLALQHTSETQKQQHQRYQHSSPLWDKTKCFHTAVEDEDDCHSVAHELPLLLLELLLVWEKYLSCLLVHALFESAPSLLSAQEEANLLQTELRISTTRGTQLAECLGRSVTDCSQGREPQCIS